MSSTATGDSGSSGSLRNAFKSWWAILGIIATSITGFRILLRVTNIHLAPIIAYVIAKYHEYVHVPVWWLFQLIHLPKPPEWIIDVVMLYLLIGGVAGRTQMAIDKPEVVSRYFVMRLLGWAIVVTTYSVLWPFFIYQIFEASKIHYDEKGGIHLSNQVMCRVGDVRDTFGRKCECFYSFDAIQVLLIQALTALLAVLGWVVWNALTELPP